MFNYLTRRKTEQLTNRAIINWLEDLDSMIVLLDDAITELSKDLADLTDFVEENLD
jgi:hypothetical protein